MSRRIHRIEVVTSAPENIGKMVKNSAMKSAAESKPTMMKAVHAAHIVDKNSRTIAKILQLLDVTQRPTSASLDPNGHTTKRIEKLKSRVNRRLQKLARWGDKPVDDRQPAEMRMMLRSGIQPQFRPSYGSVMTGSATSQPLGTGSAFMSSRSQSTQNLTAAVSNSNSRSSAILHSATAAAALTAPSTLPNRSLSLNENKDGNLFNREGLSSSSSSTIAITQALPAFSNLHEQSEIFGLNPSPSGSSSSSSSKGTSSEAPINKVSAAPSDENCSTNGKVMSMGMMGTMGGGMSMGGMSSTGGAKIDIDAIRALQMQSVKELSDALKGHDQGGSK